MMGSFGAFLPPPHPTRGHARDTQWQQNASNHPQMAHHGVFVRSVPLLIQGAVARTASVEQNTKETQVRSRSGSMAPGRGRSRPRCRSCRTCSTRSRKHEVLRSASFGAAGDVEIDGHHTVEDVGLVLGTAFEQRAGRPRQVGSRGTAGRLAADGRGAGDGCAVDFSGRPAYPVCKWTALAGKWIGDFDCELAKEFFAGVRDAARGCNLHRAAALRRQRAPHDRVHRSRRSRARCDMATAIDPRLGGAVPSTKGTLAT